MTTQALRDLPIRATVFIAIFGILSFYLYGIQLAYESPGQHPVAKLSLFACVVMGGGLSWDVTKYLSRLESSQLRRFFSSIVKTGAFVTAYIGFFVLVALLLSEWKGPQTIATPFIAILTLFFCVKTNLSLTAAIEIALEKENKLPRPD